MSNLCELAKFHRQALNETQTQYAKRFGYDSATAVSLWESGQRKVPNKVIEAVLEGKLPTFKICEHCNGRGVIIIAPPIKQKETER